MQKAITKRTKQWVYNFVIQHNLCPFAKKVYVQNRIAYIVNFSEDVEELLHALVEELQLLNRIPLSEIETTLFIIPNALLDFEDYLDFITISEKILTTLDLEGILQLASFHPKYQFAGTEIDDVENFTNRSPYPMVHILREESMTKAVKNYPNPKEIPEKNIELMKKLGLKYLQNISNPWDK